MAQERHCARLDYNFGSIVGQVVLDVLNDALMNEGYNLALGRDSYRAIIEHHDAPPSCAKYLNRC